MYSLSMQTEGADSIIRMLKYVPYAVKEEVGRAMEKSAYKMEGTAKSNAPVKTGSLRRNIKKQKLNVTSSNIEITIDASVKNKYGDDYAPYQEFGTRRGIKPVFYMKKSRESNEQYFETQMSQAVGKAIKRAFSIS